MKLNQEKIKVVGKEKHGKNYLLDKTKLRLKKEGYKIIEINDNIRDWRRPLNCPKCKGVKTFQEGFCDKCGYDVTYDYKSVEKFNEILKIGRHRQSCFFSVTPYTDYIKEIPRTKPIPDIFDLNKKVNIDIERYY